MEASPKTQRVRVKICGITREADAIEAARLGADFIGFVLYPPSPRFVEPERAGAIALAMREVYGVTAPKAIGVFVDAPTEQISRTRRIAHLDGVQLCGDESPAALAALAPLRIRTLSLETLERLGRYEVEAYLCDAHAPVEKGGTGRSYDYERLRPYIDRYPIVIAGGLTPATVGEVVRGLRPWGVDASSALEARPGVKDHDLLRAFMEAVRAAEADF